MKAFVTILLVLSALQGAYGQLQQEVVEGGKPVYFRKEEILVDGKRYRIHNNYFTFGPGILASSLRNTSQQSLNLDLQFHIRRQHFQAGVMMSGLSIGSNNNVQAHFGYGYRKETKTSNLAIFVGPTYCTGVVGLKDSILGTIPWIYTYYGAYVCGQAVYKLTFDIGIGAEAFIEYSRTQKMAGLRLIAFFSSAYVGPKRNYNPNVRTQTAK